MRRALHQNLRSLPHRPSLEPPPIGFDREQIVLGRPLVEVVAQLARQVLDGDLLLGEPGRGVAAFASSFLLRFHDQHLARVGAAHGKIGEGAALDRDAGKVLVPAQPPVRPGGPLRARQLEGGDVAPVHLPRDGGDGLEVAVRQRGDQVVLAPLAVDVQDVDPPADDLRLGLDLVPRAQLDVQLDVVGAQLRVFCPRRRPPPGSWTTPACWPTPVKTER